MASISASRSAAGVCRCAGRVGMMEPDDAHGSILAPHTAFMRRMSAYVNPRYRRSRGAMSGARSQAVWVAAAAAGLEVVTGAGLVVAPSLLARLRLLPAFPLV